MISDPLRGVSDATIALAGFWAMVGWIAGFAFALCIWWRPISRARHDARAMRHLRAQLEDSDRQLTAAFAQADRMAEMLAQQMAHTDDQGRVA